MSAKNGLSSWAMKDEAVLRARKLDDEKEDKNFRSPYARDRDRILYSKSFRRLAHKTQVYLTSSSNKDFDDHCRTRLTHTLEVAQIAKSIASRLNLNIDLAEAIAFGHDVGHAPFGHAGERQIDEFLNSKDILPKEVLVRIEKYDEYVIPLRSFNHNFQSVRLLGQLERYSCQERAVGLNLSYQTLYGILSHTRMTIKDGNNVGKFMEYPDFHEDMSFEKLSQGDEYKSLEAVIVAIADEIAQVVHDLCDAIKIEAVEFDFLYGKNDQISKIIKKCENFAQKDGKSVNFSNSADLDEKIAQLCTALVHYFSVKTSNEIKSLLDEAAEKGSDLLSIIEKIKSPYPIDDFRALDSFKRDVIVNNYSVNRMDNKGRYIIRGLFKAYISDPRQLPDHSLYSFVEMKRRESRSKGNFAERIKSRGDVLQINPRLTAEQIAMSMKAIDDIVEGCEFRRIDRKIVHNLVPYLALDSDYLRVIADYISSMTDSFAEREFQSLFI